MKLLVFVMFVFSLQAYAQPEYGTLPSLVIPAAPSSGSGGTISPKVSIWDEPAKPEDTRPLSDPTPISLYPQNKFVDAGQPYLDKLNKKSGGDSQFKALRKDQFLGDIKTKAEKVFISYRDYQEVDGDVISVYVNGSIVRAQVALTGEYEGFELALQPGFNKIEFEAVSEGYSMPNTAAFIITDGDIKLVSGTWNLATGFKGSYLIVRE